MGQEDRTGSPINDSEAVALFRQKVMEQVAIVEASRSSLILDAF